MAGGAVSVGKGTNYGFARKLASSDRGTREEAVGVLIMWLSCQPEIEEGELKKIWKGLFYCLWHTDKVPVQAELIERLGGLLERFDVELSVSFFKVFLSTMRKEWGGIDRLRLDKFYLLLRKFIFHMFKVLDNGGWDKEVVTRFMDALKERAFLANDRFPALGVNLHLTDIFWDEFRKFLPVPGGTLGLLLEPFYSTLSSSSDKALIRRVRENVFNPLLHDCHIERARSLDGTDERVGHLLVFVTVASRLFDLASSPAVAQANRKILYELNDDFSKLSKSLESTNGIAIDGNECGYCVLNGQTRDTFAPNLEEIIQKQQVEADESTRTRLGKRQARAAVLELTLLSQEFDAGEAKKPKKAKLLRPLMVAGNEDDENELVRSGESLDSLTEGKQEKNDQEIKLKKKRKSKISAAVAKIDVPILEKKVAKRKGKKRKTGQPEIRRMDTVDRDGCALHEDGMDRTNRGFETSSQRETCAESLAVTPGCSENSPVHTNQMSMNLDTKFDGVAVEMTESVLKDVSLANGFITNGTSLAGLGLFPTRETRSKKKRSREKGPQSPQMTELTDNSPAASPPFSSVTKVELQSSNDTVKHAKKVRFALRNNLICKPHGPLPPLSARTPPSATPRGSALKPGVLPGPIRTRPIRVLRGTGLLKSRRVPRPFLTMSLQKPKISKNKFRNRQS